MEPRPKAELERPYNWRKIHKAGIGISRSGVLALLATALVLGCGAIVGYGVYKIHAPQSDAADPVSFTVLPGETYTSIADRLHKRGILHDTLLFTIDARITGLGTKLSAGRFTLRRNMSIDAMISALANDKPQFLQITIPPGLRAQQIARRLQSYGISGSQFLRAVRYHHFPFGSPKHPVRLHIPPGHSLEGFLYPDTYAVTPGTDGAAFASRMVNRFTQVFGPRMRAAARHEKRSIYRIATVASIVERETGYPPDRKKIAGVYYHRLHLGMPLQADPTVQYAAGRSGNWWPGLSVGQTHYLQSPYNTYRNSGLPPGPIDSPGWGSLNAALHPTPMHALYFLALKNGHSVFETTYQQHEQDIARYGSG